MKKIIFYIAGLQRGGAERVIANLANYFDGIGYDVTMFTDCVLAKEYPLNKSVHREIVGYEPTGKRGRDMLRRIMVIRDAYKKVQPDAVVAFIGKTNIRALLASFGTGIPVIVSVRSTPQREYRTKAMRILAKLLFARAAGVVFQTEGAKAWFGKTVQKKSAILANPLHPDAVRPRFEGKRTNEIVTVGRLERVKNHRMLIEAFCQVSTEFPETVLRIYGDGQERKALEKLIEEKNMQEKVLLMGDHDKIPELIYQSRIFVLSSDAEGMPNALMEAMALGLAVVSTDCPCGGPAMVVRHGENGLLVPIGDAKAMAEALRELLSDAEKEERFGREAHKLGEELAPERVNKAWQDYVERVSGICGTK